MKIAVEGCAHGELEKIYDTIAFLEHKNNYKVDLLLCCGDFQASRNYGDLDCMAVPPKFRQLCTFYKYYSGEKKAPILTIIIGGNHEASNYFQELSYGGWVAPNIYYLGYAGVVQVGGIRIAGLSGIFKSKDYYKGRFETVPYNEDTKRSCYHVRAFDVFRLKQISKPIHIMMSHDWPEGVYNYGNTESLLKKKPYFRQEIESNSLGSQPAAELLNLLQPEYWFSAHLHVKFPAIIKHDNNSVTKFLALDKCLPKRQFLQVFDLPHQGEIALSYDLEWLAILQLTDHLISVRQSTSYMPGPGCGQRWKFTPTEEEREVVLKRMSNDLKISNNFVQTATPHDPSTPRIRPSIKPNPQTTSFCRLLGIEDPLALLLEERTSTYQPSSYHTQHNYSSFEASLDSNSSEISWSTPVKNPTPRTSLNLPAPQKPAITLTPSVQTNTSSPVASSTQIEDEPSNQLTDSESLFLPTTPSTPGQMPPPVSFSSPKDNSESLQVASVEIDPILVKNETETEASEPKRFRRRNLAMYASTEEDN